MESTSIPGELPVEAAAEAPVERARPLVLLALLATGAALGWLLYRAGGPPGFGGWAQIAVAFGATAVAASVAGIPSGQPTTARFLRALRDPSPRARAWTAACVGAVAIIYLAASARQQHRDLYPRLHDECSYTLQARMLSDGELWGPRHALADFFETFYVLDRPVYGSIYFPGTAMMNVPGIWLRLPSWVVPILLAALVIALSYRVTAELVDGAAGLLVALLVLSARLFRTYSTMVMAEMPVMLLGLLMLWAWLRWRRERRVGWALAVGAFAGWAAITRPVDALAFAIPVGLSMAWALRRAPRALMARTAGALCLGALPFLALQATLDWGTTGAPWRTPYVSYLEQNQPGSAFGTETGGVAAGSHSTLLQKRINWSELAAGQRSSRANGVLAWAALRLRFTGSVVLPCAILLLLIPPGLLLAGARGRWVVLAAVPLSLLLYAFNPFFLRHYALPLTMATALCAVLGARAVQGAFASPLYRRTAGAGLTVALVALAIGSLPQVNAQAPDEIYRTPLLDYTREAMAQIPAPAVVLFRFNRSSNTFEEPVYNLDVAEPDDAPIIRAHDLGARDGELLRYYAQRQPSRTFWLFDRGTGNVFELGTADQAARALNVSLTPSAAPALTAADAH